MKISKATREAAANYCNAMAWWWEAPTSAMHPSLFFGSDAFRLAREAGDKAYASASYETSTERWLEAEILIRDGWTP